MNELEHAPINCVVCQKPIDIRSKVNWTLDDEVLSCKLSKNPEKVSAGKSAICVYCSADFLSTLLQTEIKKMQMFREPEPIINSLKPSSSIPR